MRKHCGGGGGRGEGAVEGSSLLMETPGGVQQVGLSRLNV